jgi:hypothetical protein
LFSDLDRENSTEILSKMYYWKVKTW